MERDIAVLVPAHNEEREIGALVRALRNGFETVVVVDDGSRDRTAAEARGAGATVIAHPACRGKGAALKTGFDAVGRMGVAAVITMDGDGQHPVGDAARFVRAYRRRPDVAVWVGRRKIAGTPMPFIRRATNVCMSVLISLIARRVIPDSQNGFRLIARDAMRAVPVATSHFEMESEFLIRAAWRGFRIGSVPVSTIYRQEKSKIRPAADTARFFRMVGGLLLPSAPRASR